MSLSRFLDYAIAIMLSMTIGVLFAYYLQQKTQLSPAIAFIPFILTLIAGLIIVRRQHKKEGYALNLPGDSAGATINIIQNCGSCNPTPGPTPVPPGPAPLTKDAVAKWIKSVDTGLTANCSNCIIDKAMQLWNSNLLEQISTLPMEKQKTILNAMLAVDCVSQCIIPVSNLDKQKVIAWVNMIVPTAGVNCQACAVDYILKHWSSQNFSNALVKMKEEQVKILEGIIAFNCPKCDAPIKLDAKAVQAWLTGLLTGANPDCYSCAINTIVRLWSVADFNKIKKMDKKSQIQVIQALLALNCSENCIEVPSGLTPGQVNQWLASILDGENNNCYDCLSAFILKHWTPAMLNTAKQLPKIEQSKVVAGLIAANCQSECLSNSTLTKQQVTSWVKQILPTIDAVCVSCIVAKAMQIWNKQDFTEVMSKPTKDQAVIAKAMADYNCPHVCQVEPLEECNYLPY